MYKVHPGVSRGRGCTHIMHDRSLETIDPRIPTVPERSTSVSTDQQALLAPRVNRREVLGASNEG